MKKKLICILICTLLIATSTVVTVSSNENRKTEEITGIDSDKIGPTNEFKSNDNYSTGGGFEQCISACLGMTLAGNCIYLIFGCAVSPGPHNFCCWAVPIFCGVDIGLLLSCIVSCTEISEDLNDPQPCFPERIKRVIELIQNSNSSGPAIILGLLCILQKWRNIKEWLKEEGYQNIELPEIKDCGCIEKP
jgi:hypothetical protein